MSSDDRLKSLTRKRDERKVLDETRRKETGDSIFIMPLTR